MNNKSEVKIKNIEKFDVAIVGGGMSGLTSAVILSEKGLKVCIFERQDTIGKKLKLTGNGKCNLTNMDMSESKYICDDEKFFSNVLSKYDVNTELNFYKSIGLYTKEKNGYVYPVSNQAQSVVSVFNENLKNKNVKVFLNDYVKDISRNDKGNFTVIGNTTVYAKRVIIATGGKAGVYKENEFNGFKVIKKLGHSVTKMYPGLVQTLSDDEDFFKETKGVRVDAKASLYINEKEIASDTGELQITDKGLSGIPVFQLSRYIGKALDEKKNVKIKLDYLPQYSYEALEKDIMDRFNKAVSKEKELNEKLTAEKLFDGILNSKLETALLKKAHISPTKPLREGLEDKISNFISLIKEDEVLIKGLNDFDKAQISVGGVPLMEIKESFESNKENGIYILGEALNVSGECGGYNLHFAWLSGLIAANDIMDSL